MSQNPAPRVFVPGTAINENRDGLEPASADDTFAVGGPVGRYELPGYLIAIDDLHARGVPRNVAREVAMIVSLRTSEHVILLAHEGGIWELLIESGKHGLPDTYTFKAASTGKSGTL